MVYVLLKVKRLLWFCDARESFSSKALSLASSIIVWACPKPFPAVNPAFAHPCVSRQWPSPHARRGMLCLCCYQPLGQTFKQMFFRVHMSYEDETSQACEQPTRACLPLLRRSPPPPELHSAGHKGARESRPGLAPASPRPAPGRRPAGGAAAAVGRRSPCEGSPWPRREEEKGGESRVTRWRRRCGDC